RTLPRAAEAAFQGAFAGDAVIGAAVAGLSGRRARRRARRLGDGPAADDRVVEWQAAALGRGIAALWVRPAWGAESKSRTRLRLRPTRCRARTYASRLPPAHSVTRMIGTV